MPDGFNLDLFIKNLDTEFYTYARRKEEEEEIRFIVTGRTKGRVCSEAIYPAPLVFPDRVTQVSRP